MAFFNAENGKKVFYEYHRGTKRPILLLHGWAMSTRVWASTIEVLRDAGHTVVAMDHRGCGRSDQDFTDTSIDAIAGDVVGLAKELGLDGLVLNGWSLGGAVAVQAAEGLGASVGGLVLTCAASPRYTRAEGFDHGGNAEDVRALESIMRANRAGFFHGLSQAVCAKPVGQPVIDWMWSIFMESGVGVGRTITGLADLDQRDLLASLDVPILSIVGTADTFTPPEIGAFAAKIAKKGQLASFDGCGHAPFIEDFDAYMACLMKFMNGLDNK